MMKSRSHSVCAVELTGEVMEIEEWRMENDAIPARVPSSPRGSTRCARYYIAHGAIPQFSILHYPFSLKKRLAKPISLCYSIASTSSILVRYLS